MKIIKKKLEFYSNYYFEIINIINSAGGDARIVGGAVRDAYLGMLPSDIDIATRLKPGELITLFQKHQIKTIPTGIKFGTITVVRHNESFQITTLRRDITCDGRHAEVAYSDDCEEDAKRRDFTINALSYCPIQEEIYDYFNGIEDLQNRKVIFIGDPNERIQEDYLRILRFFRFSSNYADVIDEAGKQASYDYRLMLQTLSRERIKSEMDKIILSKNSLDSLYMMDNLTILDIIFPRSNYNYFLHLKLDKIENSYHCHKHPNIIYALFFKDANINIKDLLDLKFSKIDIRNILKLIEVSKFQDHDIYNYLMEIWLDEKEYEQYFIFIAAINDIDEEIYQLYLILNDLKKPTFLINGNDLSDLGLKGEEIGIILKKLRKIWIKYDFNMDKKTLIKIALHDDELDI